MVIRMTITKSLIAKFLHKRILYINNKLSNCIGYSPAEKKIRIEELQGLLKIVENTPEAKSEFVSEVNISELLKVCRQNEAQYDAVVKQNRQLQTQMNAYKQALEDIAEQVKLFDVSLTVYYGARDIPHDIADKVEYYQNKIFDIINKAKEGK